MDPGTALTIVATVLLSFATVAVVLHLIFRFGVLKVWGSDDYCVIGAIIISIGMLISINLGVHLGIGKEKSIGDMNTAALGRTQLAIQILYIVSSGLVKISVLLLYRRIFMTLRRIAALSAVIVGLITIAFMFTAIFQCKPVGSYWLRPTDDQHYCISLLIFWCDVAVVYLLTNIWIFCLPLKPMFDLHMKLKQKLIAIALLCSAGLCTVVTAAIRLAYVVHLYKGTDKILDVVPVYLCSAVEISAALVALSAPSLRLFYQKCAPYLSSLIDDHNTKPRENEEAT